MTVRFFSLQTHYRTPIDFSNEALQAAEKGYARLMNSLLALNELSYSKEMALDKLIEKDINHLLDSLYLSMSDDFNTSKPLASIFDLSKYINSFKDGNTDIGSISKATFERLKDEFLAFVIDVLGLTKEESAGNDKLKGVINLLLEIRKEARSNKDFALSDKIRDDLNELGIQVKDSKSGDVEYVINN